MGWKLQYNDAKNWDLKWNDCAITPDFLSKMASHQKINHFPGLYKFIQEWEFFPERIILEII